MLCVARHNPPQSSFGHSKTGQSLNLARKDLDYVYTEGCFSGICVTKRVLSVVLQPRDIIGGSLDITALPSFLNPSQELSGSGGLGVDVGCPEKVCGGLSDSIADALSVKIARACVRATVSRSWNALAINHLLTSQRTESMGLALRICLLELARYHLYYAPASCIRQMGFACSPKSGLSRHFE